MVYRDRSWEKCLDGYGQSVSRLTERIERKRDENRTFDHGQARSQYGHNGDLLRLYCRRRILISDGCLSLLEDMSCISGNQEQEGKEAGHTFGPSTAVRAEAKASQPIIKAISWTRDLTSREAVSLDRRRLSLDTRHG